MSAYVLHGLNECRHLQVVPVISSFDCDGNIFPLYVRIDGQSLKIYNARRVDSTIRIINFNCEVKGVNKTFLSHRELGVEYAEVGNGLLFVCISQSDPLHRR